MAGAPSSGNITMEQQSSSYPRFIRFLAHLFSWLFHPLFITSYVMAFLIFVHPYVYAGADHQNKLLRITHIISTTAFFPLFSVFLMWRLRLFLDSIYLRTAKERIIPYIIAMTFYWWSWDVFKNLPDSPPVTVYFLFGNFLAICGAFLCNIYFKISMHAVAMGGLMIFFLMFSLQDGYSSGSYISIAFLVAGIVCSSRLMVSDHHPFDIYAGLLVGMLAQYIAWLI
jgi:hypothetical protein